MKKNKLFLLLLLFYSIIITAQITAIPDQNFEQALIDLNIDSDGTVNGQVLTSDISNIVTLDFENVSNFGIVTDFTGIEDFSALEVLDFYNWGLLLDESQADIFTNNLNLRELTITNSCGDCGSTYIPILNLSGLPNLELVNLSNVVIQSIILNNPDFDLNNLTLNLYHEGAPGVDWINNICIEVDNPQNATNNLPPYDTWNIIIYDVTTTYSFGSNCNLSINNFENLNSISLYPNPVIDNLLIENPNQIPIEKIEVFNITGRKVKTFTKITDNINLESLSQGMYFIKVINKNEFSSFKVLKSK